MPNGWRTIKSSVHKIRLHGRRGKGMAESLSREKLRQAPQKEGGWKVLGDFPPEWPRLVRPTNLMSRMNGKETHTTQYVCVCVCVCVCVYCHSIYSGRQTCGRASRGHTGGGHTRFIYLSFAVLALTFLARRIQPFFSLVDGEVEFCVQTN